jgi:hypothetical protein
MISDPQIAKRVNELLLDAFYRVDESCSLIRDSCPPEEYSAYLKATSGVVGGIVMDVLEKLYEKHPFLKPHNWDD